MTTTEVLIVGAGPTGLVLALWLTRRGVRVRIIDKAAEAGTTSRALAVQARTLEFYRQLGLADAVVERGRRVDAANLWAAGKHAAHMIFGEMGKGISPFPYALIFPQDEHERLLIEHLATAGVEVERRTELLSFEEVDRHVVAHIRKPDGTDESCTAAYIAGGDGAHSKVRETLGINFPGGTYEHLFYVADVEATGPVMNGELHVALDRTDFLAVFPLKDARRARLIGTVRDDSKQEALSWNDVSKRVLEWIRIDVKHVNWFSTYRVHHRVADTFRKGRAFLLGDAAHIHSPVGGQGMNTGIGDAVNLAWKLAGVMRHGSPSILDTYGPERIAFAKRLVATTDEAFIAVTSSSAKARLIRLQVVPFVIPFVFMFNAARRFMFRTISQTTINYRESNLSEGNAGDVHGGDRLPWIKLPDGTDNFTPLTSLDWQVHVYGDPHPDLKPMCGERHLSLEIFPWHDDMKKAGLSRDATYLIRPDGYVALAKVKGDSSPAIVSFLEARGIVRW